MKTTLKLFAMLMLVTFMASCSESSDELGTTQPTGEKVYMTFSGSADEEFSGGTDEELRTRINSKDNKKIDFAAGDAISVFDSKNSNNKFTTTEGGSQVKFSGTATQSDNYTFLYPYQNSATISGGKISAVIPAEQTATVGTFDPAANLSVAKADGKGVVNLKNICSLIRLNVAVNCASVTLTDLGGRAVAGAVTINPETYEVAPAATGASKSVTLKNLTAGKIYYIAILPGAIKLNLEFRTSAYEGFIKSKASQIILERSKVLNVGQVVSSPKEEFVDLGLPSCKLWAKCNIGATASTGYGNFFAWGETKTKTTYTWANYSKTFVTDTYSSTNKKVFKKYTNNNTTYTATGYLNTDDAKKTVLDLSDDVANVQLGGNWRMPTTAEYKELCDNTTNKWTTKSNIKGRLFTSKTNSSATIFFPAAGKKGSSSEGTIDQGSGAGYWESSLIKGTPSTAYQFVFNNDEVYYSFDMDGDRRWGRTVRAIYVSKK
ncbi:MAG: hypothetical protein KBT27_03595 [Prevotellaceae bacterium]|nr:hypothetical protein [Candidatus Faecinaster equi]